MDNQNSVDLEIARGKTTMNMVAEKLSSMGFKVYMPENEFGIYFSDKREDSVAKISPILRSAIKEVSILTQCKDTAMFESNKIIEEKIQAKDITFEILTKALKESKTTGQNRAFLSTKEWLEPYLKEEHCPDINIVNPNTSFMYLPYDEQGLEGLSKDEILSKINAPKDLEEKVLTMTVGAKRVMYFHDKEDLKKAIDAGLSEDEKEEMYQNAIEGGVIDLQEKFAGKIMKELPLDPIHADEKMTGGYFFDLIESTETILIDKKTHEPVVTSTLPKIEELDEEPMFYRLN